MYNLIEGGGGSSSGGGGGLNLGGGGTGLNIGNLISIKLVLLYNLCLQKKTRTKPTCPKLQVGVEVPVVEGEVLA